MRAVNLLTPELRTTSKVAGAPAVMDSRGGLGAFVLLGALALCVAGIAAYVLAGNVVKQRTAQLADVKAQTGATVAEAARLKPFVDFQTVAQARAGTVQALASARFDWEQSLRDLSRAIPSNVYLSSLNGTVGGSAAQGGGSSLRGAITSPAIELKGCTRSQPAVAGLMSRLRNVQGVTRVSLAKSDKLSSGTGATTASPCGKGSPPSFELVVFFEGATVDTALAAATGEQPEGAAAASATATKQAKGAASPTPAATTQGAAKP
jgi:Tfp pilus assembly protein PilN